MKDISGKIAEFINKSKTEGLNFPMIQDPKTKQPSITATMVIVSFGLMGFCTILTTLMAVNKLANFFTASDSAINVLKEAFSMSIQMSGVSLGAYLGRKFQAGKNSELGSNENAQNVTEVENNTVVQEPRQPRS